MTTRAGLRGSVRAELNDGGSVALWSDALLHQWLAEAIRDYGRRRPREASQTILSVAGQADYPLAADCQRVARVEHPGGFFRLPDPLSAGDRLNPFGAAEGLPRAAGQLAFEVWGSFGALVLSLRPAPAATGESIAVRYLAVYAEPAADGDALATPAQDDHLLIWYVAGRALQWLGTDESKRQRWERDRGATAQAAAEVYRRAYESALGQQARRAAPRRLALRG